MVPVLDKYKKPMMPCSEKRARLLMSRGQATAYWQKGIFCIRLVKEPSARKYQAIALGIDPGSKREGYTVATEKNVVLNITTNTPYWVKSHIETRRILRRVRRQRKTPYRKCRENRSSLRNVNRVPPSTKSRWDAKLNMIKSLNHIMPITIINIEDIKAKSLKGKKKWNISFSPLEVGKKYFEENIKSNYSNIFFIKTAGYETYSHRQQRGFTKSKSKLDYTWEAHNVDSHSLVELALQVPLNSYCGLYKIEYLEYHRRQLHVQNPIKNNIRKQYGTTVSLGMPRGSVLKYKNKLCYLGGNSKGKVSIYSIITGKRIKQFAELKNIKMLFAANKRSQFIPHIKTWDSLRNYL